MKKKILATAVVAICLLMTGIVAVMISASEMSPADIVVPQFIEAMPSCGPFVATCYGADIYDESSHPFTLDGYMKTCIYKRASGYTIYKCTECGKRVAYQNVTHFHGELEHIPSQCGMENYWSCPITGEVMDELPDGVVVAEFPKDQFGAYSREDIIRLIEESKAAAE